MFLYYLSYGDYMKKICLLLISFLLVSGCTTVNPSSSTSQNENLTTTEQQTTTSSGTFIPPSSNLYVATIASNAPNYYESVRGLKGEALKIGLHNIIKGHKTFAYNSNINSYMKEYDAVYGNSNQINLIYTGAANKGTSFNKEHVWAKSHGDFGTGQGPGSDLHNLRPCYNNLNSTRGSLDFAEGGSEISNYPKNYKTSSTFEPRDDFKGDVARTIFYMATRYEGNESNYPDLELESPSNTSRYLDLSKGAKGVHGDFDDLYKWATSGEDPVDNYEVNRNNIIYDKYQHNRNPFVDHPEFIVMIYDKQYSGPGALNDLLDGSVNANPQESANKVIELINNIGAVTLDSLAKIEEAETAYNNLTNDAKGYISSEIFQKLTDARNQYNTLYEANAVSIVISLIDNIGTVTLDSLSVIEKAEVAYNNLSASQKTQISNYEQLVSAREKYNELKAQTGGNILYTGDFNSNVSGATSSYGTNVSITVNNQPWIASSCYKASGEDLRLGHNKNASCVLEEKFSSIVGSSCGASLEMNWDDSNIGTIRLNVTGKKHGTVNKVYIVKSIDGGQTYQICEEFSFSESTYLYEYQGEKGKSVRYAIVITGSNAPRMYINKIELLS